MGFTTSQRGQVVPRKELENTQPVRVRIANADLARIDEIYKYIGVHGNISEVIRKGARLQIFIEEVTRDRITVEDDVRAAIHTLQVALDRRDRVAYDESQVKEEVSSGKKETSKENGTGKNASKKPSRKRKQNAAGAKASS